MKRLLAMLLIIGLFFTLGNSLILAEETQPKITVDGVKDEIYNCWKRIDHSSWTFWGDETHTTEPVDQNRVTNTLWFEWDEEYLYFYFQAKTSTIFGEKLYQPNENESTPPDFEQTFYEQVYFCLDLAPSCEYKAPCQIEPGKECNHFSCNAYQGKGANHRLFARCIPAWNIWEVSLQDEKTEAIPFIDYNTNTYGFELKVPRTAKETYFQFNLINFVNYTDAWDDAPELGYTQSFCSRWFTNSQDLLKIYYSDYPGDPTSEDYEIAQPVIDLLETIPQTVTLEHQTFLEQCRKSFNNLTPTQKSLVTNYEKLENAEYTMEILNTEWLISQFSQGMTQENKHWVIQAEQAYNALTASQKSAVKNRQHLLNAIPEKRALDIVEEIEKLPEMITKQEIEKIEDLEERYRGLQDKVKSKVTNYATLQSAMKIVKNLYSVQYGDVDENGTVNAQDALLILRYSVGKITLFHCPTLAAEVDRIPNINAKDALLVLKYTVGKIENFPVELPQ